MHGLGFTWTHEWEDSAGSSEMAIRIERNDGTARILGMRCDNGVNAETSYCQIAADELGMRMEDVFYRPHLDTGFFAMTPDSSTNMSINGFAIRNAARKLKRTILEEATRPSGVTPRGQYPAAFPGLKPDDLEMKDSTIYVKTDPSRRMSLADFVQPMGAEGPMCHTPEMGKGAPRSNFSRCPFLPMAGRFSRAPIELPSPFLQTGPFYGSGGGYGDRRGDHSQGGQRQ